jgi:hypothetical protein
MPLTASYPGAIKTFSEVTDGVTEMTSTDINPPYAEITAIETELGTDPAGSVATVKLRLAQSLDGAGNLDFASAVTLTIASGVITPTQNWHVVDTEGAAATDDLTTIGSTDSGDGFLLFIRQANDARDITIKHASGNIKCPGAVDIVLTDTTQIVALIYDGTLEYWLASLSPSNAALLNLANSFTAMQSFTKAVNFAYTSVSTNTTLDTTHNVVSVDASGGAKTITLPTAVGIGGRQYTIRKLDSSGNAVTIDGNGSETINGATTKVLAAQYDVATIISNNANWVVI